jgi:methionine-rich copper-binding protein CopC
MKQTRAIAIGLLVCCSVPNVALAHSKMATSEPLESATVKPGLSEIKLGFSKPVRLVLVKVVDAETKSEVATKLSPDTTYKTQFPLEIAPLDAGSYRVNWTAVGEDGHVMKGTLSFRVAK